MDQRVLYPGGEIAVTNEELNLMPEESRKGIFTILAGLNNDNDCIVTDVSPVIDPGNDATVSEGWVYLDGELLKVDAQVVPRTVGTDLYEFQKVVSFGDPALWERDYRDGSTNNVKQINRAVVVNVAAINSLSIDEEYLAQKIQGDFDENDPTKPSFLKNKNTITDQIYGSNALVYKAVVLFYIDISFVSSGGGAIVDLTGFASNNPSVSVIATNPGNVANQFIISFLEGYGTTTQEVRFTGFTSGGGTGTVPTQDVLFGLSYNANIVTDGSGTYRLDFYGANKNYVADL